LVLISTHFLPCTLFYLPDMEKTASRGDRDRD
jgi:hypothetical protein